MSNVSTEDSPEDLRERCHVSFSIAGSQLNFRHISETLNQRAAQTGRAGTRVSAALQALEDDVWSLSSPIGSLKSLDEHLRWLREQLEPHVEYLTNLSRTARLRVYIGFTFSQEQNGFRISPEFVRFFASLNALVDVWILCNCGDNLTQGEIEHTAKEVKR